MFSHALRFRVQTTWTSREYISCFSITSGSPRVVTTSIVVLASELMCSCSQILRLRLQIIASRVSLKVSNASCSTSAKRQMASTLKRCVSCCGLGHSSCPFGGMTPRGLRSRVKARACIKRLWHGGQYLPEAAAEGTRVLRPVPNPCGSAVKHRT